MNAERLPAQNNPPTQSPASQGGPLQRLDEKQIAELMAERKALLEALKPAVSRKIYYAMEEKLAQEETRLKEILDWQLGKITKLSKYSLILDPHYFDQEFLQDIN